MSSVIHAFTRAVSPRLIECELTHIDRAPIQLPLALAQHLDYEKALLAAGATLFRLPDLDWAPDGVFVEDTAVLLGEHAVLTRPGTASRAKEVASTAATLAERFVLHHLSSGSLDGGDVLRMGRTLYVGQSSRTSLEGIRALHAIVAPLGYSVQPVPVNHCLHLKTAATSPGRDARGTPILVVNPAWVDPTLFAGVRVLAVPPDEACAANTLRVGNLLLVATGNPRTCDQLTAWGFPIVELNISELHKAEAGLTCLCLLSAPEDESQEEGPEKR